MNRPHPLSLSLLALLAVSTTGHARTTSARHTASHAKAAPATPKSHAARLEDEAWSVDTADAKPTTAEKSGTGGLTPTVAFHTPPQPKPTAPPPEATDRKLEPPVQATAAETGKTSSKVKRKKAKPHVARPKKARQPRPARIRTTRRPTLYSPYSGWVNLKPLRLRRAKTWKLVKGGTPFGGARIVRSKRRVQVP